MLLVRQASQSCLTMHLVGMQRLLVARDLYRRTKHKESTVSPPTQQQGHAAQNASNHAKLPDSASCRHGKITCGKRLYRRAETKDSTAALPECQQAHAAPNAHEPAAKRPKSSCAESEMLQKDTYMQAAEQTESLTHIQMWPVGSDGAEKRKAIAQRATGRKQTSRLPQQTVEQACMSAKGKQDNKRPLGMQLAHMCLKK